MKVKFFSTLLILLFSCFIFSDLSEVYKKGILNLISDPSFGQNTDWESIFYKPYLSMVIAPDESIFVADNRTGKIIKFDQNGDFIKTFEGIYKATNC